LRNSLRVLCLSILEKRWKAWTWLLTYVPTTPTAFLSEKCGRWKPCSMNVSCFDHYLGDKMCSTSLFRASFASSNWLLADQFNNIKSHPLNDLLGRTVSRVSTQSRRRPTTSGTMFQRFNVSMKTHNTRSIYSNQRQCCARA